jgi:hypothetical protein
VLFKTGVPLKKLPMAGFSNFIPPQTGSWNIDAPKRFFLTKSSFSGWTQSIFDCNYDFQKVALRNIELLSIACFRHQYTGISSGLLSD